MSGDLQWLLLKKWNSFQVKRVPEGPVFSKEPGNLRSIHSHKDSALTNPKHITVTATPAGHIQITTRKPNASAHKVKSARHTTTLRRSSGPRRTAGIIAGHARSGYRPDLRINALARASALSASQDEKRLAAPEKKSRATKNAEIKQKARAATASAAPAKAAKAPAADDDDDEMPDLV